jgi:hypothetical protein
VAAARAGVPGALGRTWGAIRAPLSLQRCGSSEKIDDDSVKKLAEYKARLAELDKQEPGLKGFADIAASKAERRALEHWISVLETGKGPRTGSHSREPGLPKCDCTDYVSDILAETFKATGRTKEWEKLRKKAISLNKDKTDIGLNGLELQTTLMNQMGWKAIFFAPDPAYKHYQRRRRDAHGHIVQPEVWDPDTEAQERSREVRKKGSYSGMEISHKVVNYRPERAHGPESATPFDSPTVKDLSSLEKLERIPFGVLTARGGEHMTILIHAVVYEVHWDQWSNSLRLYEAKPLADWGWNSGVVVAPAADVDRAFGAR